MLFLLMGNSQARLLKLIMEIGSRCKSPIRCQIKVSHYIGMAFCRRICRGWTVCPRYHNVRLLQIQRSLISSELTKLEPLGGMHAIFAVRDHSSILKGSSRHSHLSAQYTSGAFGAMIFYGEEDGQDYDVDVGPVILQDW